MYINRFDILSAQSSIYVSFCAPYLDNGLNYSAKFNISDARTKITRYPNNPTNAISTYIEGRYINEIWGYETVGLAKTDAEMQAHLATLPNGGQNALGSDWRAGDIMYADLNGDGKISGGAGTLNDTGDMKVIGKVLHATSSALT